MIIESTHNIKGGYPLTPKRRVKNKLVIADSGNWWSSLQYSATNAVHLSNGSFDDYYKTTSISVIPVYEICKMREWCKIEEVYAAYLDCRRRKRNSYSCSVFESNELACIYNLWEELNTHTYTIGVSDAFCVTRPKIREVFAAKFKDRVVHHLLIGKILPYLECYFITDTYNCRKGKGTDYGVRRVAEMATKYKDGWVIKMDIKGFFMSIYKPLLAKELEYFLRAVYKEDDIEDIVWLSKMIVLHSPEKNCKRKGDLSLWSKLPAEKSLFSNGDDYGLAIGNLTSQIFANFYLHDLDEMLSKIDGVSYGRYVDDFVIFSNQKEVLLKLIPHIREILDSKKLILHPKKVYIQPVRHGLTFIGSIIKPSRIYAGRRTIGNATDLIRFYNNYTDKEDNIDSFAQRYNSYMGYLIHRETYAIRRLLWEKIEDDVKKYCYIENMSVLKVRNDYKQRTKLIQQYGKNKRAKRKLA